MLLRKKLALMITASTLSVTALVGCTNNESSSNNKNVTVSQVLTNQNARAAINMAMNKQQMVDVILNNGSIPASYFVASGLAVNEDGKDYRELAGSMGYDFNVEEAATAWKKAKEEVGFDKITLELLTYDSDTSKRQAEFMQSELQKSLDGLTIEIKQQPFKQKLELEAKGEFELAHAGWGADYQDPLTFLETMVSNGQYAHKVSYSNEKYDKLIKEAKASTSIEESWAKYAEAEKLMLEDGFIAPLYQRGVSYLQKDYVKDIFVFPSVQYTYKWGSLNNGKSELNLANSSDIPTLDMSKASDTVSFEVASNTMEGLTRINSENKVTHAIAESYEISEDGKTWRFNIRKGSKWSDGTEVTAKDFEYSWKRTLNPTTASEYAYIMYDVVGAEDYNKTKSDNPESVGIKSIDNYTLEVKLNRPVTYFDKLMAFPLFFPQNQAFVEAKGDKYGTTFDNTLYNGPFILSNWKLEDQYTMTKNNDYWDTNSVKLEKINTKIVKDSNAAVNLYEAGEIDRVSLSSEHVDKYKNSADFKTREDGSTFFLLINGKK